MPRAPVAHRLRAMRAELAIGPCIAGNLQAYLAALRARVLCGSLICSVNRCRASGHFQIVGQDLSLNRHIESPDARQLLTGYALDVLTRAHEIVETTVVLNEMH